LRACELDGRRLYLGLASKSSGQALWPQWAKLSEVERRRFVAIFTQSLLEELQKQVAPADAEH